MKRGKLLSNERGLSILDLMVSLTLCSIMLGSAVFQLKNINDSSDSTTDQIVSVIRGHWPTRSTCRPAID